VLCVCSEADVCLVRLMYVECAVNLMCAVCVCAVRLICVVCAERLMSEQYCSWLPVPVH